MTAILLRTAGLPRTLGPALIVRPPGGDGSPRTADSLPDGGCADCGHSSGSVVKIGGKHPLACSAASRCKRDRGRFSRLAAARRTAVPGRADGADAADGARRAPARPRDAGRPGGVDAALGAPGGPDRDPGGGASGGTAGRSGTAAPLIGSG